MAESPELARIFTLSGPAIAGWMIAYGFIASVLPVWMLLCPRDYLSTFMKIGTIILLAIGIVVLLPPLKLPAVTRFVDGTGPIFAGKLFPFAFITIACGAISGFHALVASGTTPKMLRREERRPADRLRRHADGIVRRGHGDLRRRGAGSGRVFRHQRARPPPWAAPCRARRRRSVPGASP